MASDIEYCFEHQDGTVPKIMCEFCQESHSEIIDPEEMCLEHNMPKKNCFGCRNDRNMCIHGNTSLCFLCRNSPKRCPHGNMYGCQICEIYNENSFSIGVPFIPEKNPTTPFGSPSQGFGFH